jgi:hypothetical protein
MEPVKTPLEVYAEKHFALRYYSYTGNFGLGPYTRYYAELVDIQPKDPFIGESSYSMTYTGESDKGYPDALRKAWELIVDNLGWIDADEIEAPPARPGRAAPGANRVPPGSAQHTAPDGLQS